MDRTEQRANIFKALGHSSRMRMVERLTRGEQCVCELQELVGSDMSTVSKHLAVLKNAGIVSMRKKGTNAYYSLRMQCISSFLTCVDTFLQEQASERLKKLQPA